MPSTVNLKNKILEKEELRRKQLFAKKQRVNLDINQKSQKQKDDDQVATVDDIADEIFGKSVSELKDEHNSSVDDKNLSNSFQGIKINNEESNNGKDSSANEYISKVLKDKYNDTNSLNFIGNKPKTKKPLYFADEEKKSVKDSIKSIFPLVLQKSLAVFLLLALLISIPLYTISKYAEKHQRLPDNIVSIVDATSDALLDLQNGNISTSNQKFALINQLFEDQPVETKDQRLANVASSINNISQFSKDEQKVIEGLKLLNETGDDMCQLMALLGNIDLEETGLNEIDDGFSMLIEGEESNISEDDLSNPLEGEKMKLFFEGIDLFNKNITSANELFDEIEKDEIKELKLYSKSLGSVLSVMSSKQELFSYMLGMDTLRNYLVIYQDLRNSRPTGGEITGYALVEVDRGSFKVVDNIFSHTDAYEYRDGELTFPEILSRSNLTWNLQNSNWSPEVPESSKNALKIYQSYDGPEISGLININSESMKAILKQSGPIKSTRTEGLISEITFESEVTKELDSNKRGEMIAEIFGLANSKLFLSNEASFNFLKSFGVYHENFMKRNMSVYLKDVKMQNDINLLGWDGSVKGDNLDYIRISRYNLGSDKLATNIKEEQKLSVEINKNGSVKNKLEIELNYEKKTINDLDTKSEYFRVEVPKDSKILEVIGFNPVSSTIKSNSQSATENEANNMLGKMGKMSEQSESGGNYKLVAHGDKMIIEGEVTLSTNQSKKLLIVYQPPFVMEKIDHYSIYVARNPTYRDLNFDLDIYSNAYKLKGEKNLGGDSLGDDIYRTVGVRR